VSKLVTSDQLVADAYLYAAQVPGPGAFVTPAQALRLVNLACGEFYDLVVSARGHEHYIDEADIALEAGRARYDLPPNFYEMFAVTIIWGLSPVSLGSVDPQDVEDVPAYATIRDRVRYLNGLQWARRSAKAFRLRGQDGIEFLPVPTSPCVVRIQYLPVFDDLFLTEGQFDGINGWERMISLRVAIDMCAIAQRASGALDNLYATERQRVIDMVTERAAEHPSQLRETFPEGGYRGRFFP
jgi:hypothetical protein